MRVLLKRSSRRAGCGIDVKLHCSCLAPLKRGMNDFNRNTRQKDSCTVVAGQMKELMLGFLGSRGGFPLGMALGWGVGVAVVTVELILTLSGGALAVQVGEQCDQLEARVGCVWKTERSLWGAGAGGTGREAKTPRSLALQGD